MTIELTPTGMQGDGWVQYTFGRYRLYESDAGWQIADGGGWYPGIHPTADEAVAAARFENETWQDSIQWMGGAKLTIIPKPTEDAS